MSCSELAQPYGLFHGNSLMWGREVTLETGRNRHSHKGRKVTLENVEARTVWPKLTALHGHRYLDACSCTDCSNIVMSCCVAHMLTFIFSLSGPSVCIYNFAIMLYHLGPFFLKQNCYVLLCVKSASANILNSTDAVAVVAYTLLTSVTALQINRCIQLDLFELDIQQAFSTRCLPQWFLH